MMTREVLSHRSVYYPTVLALCFLLGEIVGHSLPQRYTTFANVVRADQVDIGASGATGPLGVQSTTGSPLETLIQYNASSGGTKNNYERCRGTPSAPITVGTTDQIHNERIFGCDGSAPGAFFQAGEERWVVDGTPTAGHIPGKWSIFTTLVTGGAPTERFIIDSLGHITPGLGPSPIPSSCGSGATLTGTDNAGVITIGTGDTACTITFTNPWNSTTVASVPRCIVTPLASTSATWSYANTASALTITDSTGAFAGKSLNYICLGSP